MLTEARSNDSRMMKYLAIGHSKAKLEFAAGTNFTSDDDPAEIFPFLNLG